MSKLLYYNGPEFYKQTLQHLVKFTDNTLLAENFKGTNFSSTHIDYMRKQFNKQACHYKVKNFKTVASFVKVILKNNPSGSCKLDLLNEQYLSEVNKIQAGVNKMVPTLTDIVKTAGLSLKEVVESVDGVVVVGDIAQITEN